MKIQFLISIIIGGVLVYSCQNGSGNNLLEKQIVDIKTEVKETAIRHLNSENAISTLSYYTKDATIISNGIIHSSFESFSEDIEKFYSSLSKINIAAYDQMEIKVITTDAALLTAKFRWSSTDTSGIRSDLHGVYSALYVRENSQWKMNWRHESF